MVSIRGPKSALTDYIEENEIKSKNLIPRKVNIELPVRIKKHKKTKQKSTIELVNVEKRIAKLQDIAAAHILASLQTFKLTDSQLKLISQHLSRERMMNEFYFQYLVENCEKELYIYDCSMIKNELFVINKKLIVLELHYCGQLSQFMLNSIIRGMNKLKRLVLKGGFLLVDFTLHKSIEYIDISDCSRVKTIFIDRINKTFDRLDVLRLSHCYGLDDTARLKVSVNELYICETSLTYQFFADIPNLYKIKSLSIKKCPNLFMLNNEGNIALEKFTALEYLDCEGISTIRGLNHKPILKHLNIAYCFNIDFRTVLNNVELTYLDMSRVDPDADTLRSLVALVELKVLKLSWSQSLTDEIMHFILENLKKLELVHVFGCFGLTEGIGQVAWSKKGRLEIIGSPSETLYLLNN